MPIKTTSFLLDLFSVNREENLITASLLFIPQMYNTLYYNDMCWGGGRLCFSVYNPFNFIQITGFCYQYTG